MISERTSGPGPLVDSEVRIKSGDMLKILLLPIAFCECLGVEFRIGGHASVGFRVGGHARWLWYVFSFTKVKTYRS